ARRLRDSIALKSDFVAVVGASGSGKSSLVKAGLVPLLTQQFPPDSTWGACVCVPGTDPFRELGKELWPLMKPEQDTLQRLAGADKLGKLLADGELSLRAAVEEALKVSTDADRLLIVVDQFEELFTQNSDALQKRFVEAVLDLPKH